jgi:hypothetical protein
VLVKNARTSFAWIQVAAFATAVATGCVENDDKKAPPPPVAPAPVVPPEPARASLTINPATAYTIATPAGKCLEFGGKDDTSEAQVATCTGASAQEFKLQTVPGGYYAIVNVNTGKCLDVAAFGMDDSAQVQQYECNGGQNQNWIVATGTGGAVRLIARHSGKALSVMGSLPGDAGVAKVAQATAGSGANQQFLIKGPTPPEPPPAAADAAHKGKEKEAAHKKKGKATAAAAKKP